MNGNFNENLIKLPVGLTCLNGNNMSVQDIDKSYVSPIDKFLYKYDATHEKTQSQLKEIKKHERIANLRDNPEAGKQQDQIWQDF